MKNALIPSIVTLLAVLVFMMFPFESLIDVNNSYIVKGLVLVAVYLLTAQFTNQANHIKIDNAIANEAGEIKKLLSSDSHISFIGTREKADKVVTDKISKATLVKNTIITSNTDYVSRESHESIAAFVCNSMLDRNDTNFWYDIVSINLKDLTRFELLKEFPGRYKKDILPASNNVPLINFVIIEYENEPAEVLFGWLYSDIEGQSKVFQSSDLELVSLFDGYFNTLKYECLQNPNSHEE